MTSLAWDHVKDPGLREWLQGLDVAFQRNLAGKHPDALDRAWGDALMAEVIGTAPPRIPFPGGWDNWTDAEAVAWFNEVYAPSMPKLIETD